MKLFNKNAYGLITDGSSSISVAVNFLLKQTFDSEAQNLSTFHE